MRDNDSDDKRRGQLLSRALRAVRKIRAATSRDLARALGLSLRGYQHFEAGGGQLNVGHVMKFGPAIDCDPIGVLTAVHIGHPEFAAYVAQNKAMLAYMIELQDFVEETGPAIARLETTVWVSAYRAMFKGLSAEALAAQAESDSLLARGGLRPGLDHPSETLDPTGPELHPAPEDGHRQDEVGSEDVDGPAR